MIKNLYEKNLKNYFKKVYGKSYHTMSCYQGRLALFLLLKSYGLKKNDEVILQALTCKSIFNIIKKQKLTPKLVDITFDSTSPSEEDFIKTITPNTKVILIQSTAGITPNYKNLVRICNTKNIKVILDCAQGIPHLRDYENVDIFYSTQWNKVYSTCCGGVIMTEDKNVYENLALLEKSLNHNIVLNFVESCLNFNIYILFIIGFRRSLNRVSKYFRSNKQDTRFIKPLYISSLIGIYKIKRMTGPIKYPYRLAQKNDPVIYSWPNNLDFINEREFPNTHRFLEPIKLTYK